MGEDMAGPAYPGVLGYIRSLAGPQGGDGRSDGQLLRQFLARRDEAAFALLLQRHGPLVLGVCRQVLRDTHAAEDAFQATFLVLARKAGSVRRRESLSAWLYRVAYNLARTARAGAARRQAHERQAVTMARAEAGDEAVRDDWQPLLHEEVNRLPAKYRVPVVLCYLDGKTHEEAAREVGWPVGTVKGRLARARDLLRARLTRRGLALPAAVVTAALAEAAARAAVPASLAAATVKAAGLFAAGQSAGGAVSAEGTALAEGAIKAMGATRLKLVTVLLLAVALLGAGSGFLLQQLAAGKAPAPAPAGEDPA